MTAQPRRVRGKCRECKTKHYLRNNGTLIKHTRHRGMGEEEESCLGSWRRPLGQPEDISQMGKSYLPHKTAL